LPELLETGGDPEALVKAKGLVQISDTSALAADIDAVLSGNPKELADYRAGKTKLMGFFVGQIMRRTKGQANPAVVNQLLAEKLK
jgi:Asp-tRNAAsn/Glu-tRNAGln amidotransferase B subunit (PET112 homolog)